MSFVTSQMPQESRCIYADSSSVAFACLKYTAAVLNWWSEQNVELSIDGVYFTIWFLVICPSLSRRE
jgi:hypothetical protein